ncbi:Protein VPS-4, partial [Aphelenchoides avenae]
MTDPIKRARDSRRRAETAEANGNYADSLKFYSEAAEMLLHEMKEESRTDSQREEIRDELEDTLQRSEAIKSRVKPSKAPRAVPSGGHPIALHDTMDSIIVAVKPNVHWDDVVGLEAAKNALKESVIFPLHFPKLFNGNVNRKPWQGILLFGPPGTGKSFLAQAVATEAGNSAFFSVSSSDLGSKWHGESEKRVKQLFESARASKPAIIFVDEIDSLCSSRNDGESEATRRVKTEFMVQMNGFGGNNDGVLVIGATN